MNHVSGIKACSQSYRGGELLGSERARLCLGAFSGGPRLSDCQSMLRLEHSTGSQLMVGKGERWRCGEPPNGLEMSRPASQG